jgi:prevent-host-death family protein
MATYQVDEAQRRIEELVQRVLGGEEVVIVNERGAAARLVPYVPPEGFVSPAEQPST